MTLQEKIAYDAFMKPYQKYLSGETYEEYVEDESDDETDSCCGLRWAGGVSCPKPKTNMEMVDVPRKSFHREEQE